MPQTNQANPTSSRRMSSRIRQRKNRPKYAEVDENDNDDKGSRSKKSKSSSIIVPQPSNILEVLPSQLVKLLTSYLDPKALLQLSFATKAVYSIIDDTVWNGIIQKHCKGPAAKWKPRTPRRTLVLELTAKHTCQHCKFYVEENLKLIRCQTEYYGKRLCTKCFNLPIYKEITYSDARRQFGLTRPQLLTLSFREVKAFDWEGQFGYVKKMYNLKQVMDLARGETQ